MSNKLKNTVVILVGIIIILLAMDYSSQKIANYAAEYNSYGYSMSLTK